MSKQKKLPERMTIDSLNKVYIKELERHSNQLINEIKSFLSEPIPSDVKEASVEVFPDEYGDGYTSIGLYLTRSTTKHIPFAEYVKDLPLIDVQSYEEEISIPDLVVNHVKQWFSECWWKAGGWEYNVPIVVYGHEGFGDGESIKITKNC